MSRHTFAVKSNFERPALYYDLVVNRLDSNGNIIESFPLVDNAWFQQTNPYPQGYWNVRNAMDKYQTRETFIGMYGYLIIMDRDLNDDYDLNDPSYYPTLDEVEISIYFDKDDPSSNNDDIIFTAEDLDSNSLNNINLNFGLYDLQQSKIPFKNNGIFFYGENIPKLTCTNGRTGNYYNDYLNSSVEYITGNFQILSVPVYQTRPPSPTNPAPGN